MASRLKITLMAGGLLMAGAGLAAAEPAMVETDSNLRRGPGTNHAVITVLPQGTMIDVAECRSNWCAVAAPEQGFIARSLLDFGQAGLMAGPARADVGVAIGPSYGYGYAVTPRYGYYDAYPPGYYAHPYSHRLRAPGLGLWFGY